MAADMHQQKKVLAPSWDQLHLMTLIRAVALPACLPIVVIAGLYVWYVRANEPIGSGWYSLMLFVAYIACFVVVTLTLLRKYQMSKHIMSVVMGCTGFISGLIIAIVKLITLYEPWAIFRLLSEPIFTALFAGIIGALILWRKVKLPSESDGGIL